MRPSLQHDLPIPPPIEERSSNYVKIPAILFTILIIILFIALSIGIFFAGVYYQKNTNLAIEKSSPTVPVPTSTTQPTILPSQTPNPSSSDSGKLTTTDFPKSTNANVKRFISKNLGITFTYLEKQDQGKITVSESGNKIYVYPSSMQATSGQYVEIILKDKNETLSDAIKRTVMKGYSTNDCLLKDVNKPAYSTDFRVISINVPINDNDDPSTVEEKAKKCPPKYTAYGGMSFFIEDKNHPDKMLFFSIGQYGITTEGNKFWQDTIQLLD
jgi:hypothetical protein